MNKRQKKKYYSSFGNYQEERKEHRNAQIEIAKIKRARKLIEEGIKPKADYEKVIEILGPQHHKYRWRTNYNIALRNSIKEIINEKNIKKGKTT